MKFLAFIGLLALTMSCKDQAIDGQYTIDEGQTATITKDGQATLTVSTIQNSLCPANANCIRGGEVLVDVVATQNGSPVTASLCIGPDCQTLQKGKPAKTTLTVGGRSWTIELVNALTTTPEKAVVKIQIQ